jgi:formate dehydrogenase iron-sulfur subunit
MTGHNLTTEFCHQFEIRAERQRFQAMPPKLQAETLERVRRLVEQRGMTEAYLYGAEAGETYSSLNSFYLLVDRPSVYGLPDRPVNPWLAMKGDYLRAFASGLVSLAALLGALLLVGR